jgi:hypothetical protein
VTCPSVSKWMRSGVGGDLPAFPTGVAETKIDVCEGLLDLDVEVGVEVAGGGVAAAWDRALALANYDVDVGVRQRLAQGRSRCDERTLSSTLDPITDAYRLRMAIPS